MKKLDLFYRDGNNYKCCFSVDIEDELFFDNLVGDEDLWHNDVTMEDIGLSMYDIPSVQEWGYDEQFDHNYITILKVDGVCAKKISDNIPLYFSPLYKAMEE